MPQQTWKLAVQVNYQQLFQKSCSKFSSIFVVITFESVTSFQLHFLHTGHKLCSRELYKSAQEFCWSPKGGSSAINNGTCPTRWVCIGLTWVRRTCIAFVLKIHDLSVKQYYLSKQLLWRARFFKAPFTSVWICAFIICAYKSFISF